MIEPNTRFNIPGTLRRVLWLTLWAAWLLAPAPVGSQESLAPDEYPTAAALEAAVVPAIDLIALAQQIRGVGEIPPPPVDPPPFRVGDRQSFWVVNSGEGREFEVQATLRVVGDHIYLWLEDGAPVRADDLQALADAFDRSIYDSVRELWGSEPLPGIDGDPRLHGLFTGGLGPGVAAYFLSRHLYPTQVFPTSNEHEMFFFNLDTIGTVNIDTPIVESTLAHEFQHMIRAHIGENDAIWLNEGFSTFTQLYLYGDVGAPLAYLAAPETQLNAWAEDAPTAPHYGAAALFIAYLYQRYGLETIQALSADPGTGLDAMDHVLRERGAPGVNEFFADWVLANWLLDPTLDDGRYGYGLLPAGMPGPRPRAVVTTYPFMTTTQASQYSADYYVLNNLGGAGALDISLALPETVTLLATEPFSGQWLWYSHQGDMSQTTLTHAFDLTGVPTATLSYHIWHHTEALWDYGYITVSTDDGQTWEILPTPHTTDENPHGTAYGPGYSGDSGGWIEEAIALDAYAGQTILVSFQMITDDAISQPGLAIDAVSIPEIGYASDFETDDGGWEARGWVRIDNRLPQMAWVQAVQRAGDKLSVTRWLAPVEQRWRLPLASGADQVTLVISPFAPQTRQPMPYTLSVSPQP